MTAKERRVKIIDSSQKALDQLDKLITQNIDLDVLDPEKAKAAAQGKIEAIEGSLRILNVVATLEEMDKETNLDELKTYGGPEDILNKK